MLLDVASLAGPLRVTASHTQVSQRLCVLHKPRREPRLLDRGGTNACLAVVLDPGPSGLTNARLREARQLAHGSVLVAQLHATVRPSFEDASLAYWPPCLLLFRDSLSPAPSSASALLTLCLSVSLSSL